MAKDSTRSELNELERFLEAETGFTCYKEYLEFCETSWPGVRGVYDRSTLNPHNSSPGARNPTWPWAESMITNCSCCILDLSISEISPDLSNIIDHRFRPGYERTDSNDRLYSEINKSTAIRLFRQLRSPLGDNKIRIVCWDNPSHGLSLDVLDVLGLGLGISPGFFEALASRDRDTPFRPDLTCRRSDLVIIGEAVAIVKPQNSVVAPVVIIAGDFERYDSDDLDSNCATHHEPVSLPVPSKQLAQQRHAAPELRQDDLTKSNRFFRSFARFLEADHSSTPGCERILIASLVSLMKLDVLGLEGLFCVSYRSLKKIFFVSQDDPAHSSLYDHLRLDRKRLRRVVERSEDSVDTLNSYGRSIIDEKCLQNQTYLNVIENWQATIARARRLESEIRDFMQLKIGDLSIEESRKSIHVANLQIQEGKRVKTFTILAFIYVPLNLATSIFGMNLQQLNHNGQRLWVFLVTAVSALAVTAIIWLCFEQVNRMKAWVHQIETPGDGNSKTFYDRPSYTLSERLTMLLILVRDGHALWMYKSRAWICILRNSDQLSTFSDEAQYPDLNSDYYRVPAGHCVRKYIRRGRWDALSGSVMLDVKWSEETGN